MKTLQLTQNRMLRAINNSQVRDRISNKSLLERFALLSVNQLAAKIKLVKVWKSVLQDGCPIKLEPYHSALLQNTQNLRLQPKRVFKDSCKLKKSESSFCIDGARLWNAAPPEITLAINLNIAKKAINNFCRSLPL